MTSDLTLNKLSISFAGTEVLKNISASLPKGKITGLIGRNGSGKSTLLKAMSGLVEMDRGTIELKGQVIGDYKPKALAREITLLPQTPCAPAGLTVEELIWFGRYPYLGLWGRKSKRDKDKVQQAIDFTQVNAIRHKQVKSLSGGQQQRVWLAMTLAQDTDIILLDEPTTCLDLCYQFEMLNLLRALHSPEKTFVMILHDLNQAIHFCDELIVLDRGQIVANGKSEEVLTPELLKAVFGIECDVDEKGLIHYDALV